MRKSKVLGTIPLADLWAPRRSWLGFRERADKPFLKLPPWWPKHTWDLYQTVQRKFFYATAAPVTTAMEQLQLKGNTTQQIPHSWSSTERGFCPVEGTPHWLFPPCSLLLELLLSHSCGSSEPPQAWGLVAHLLLWPIPPSRIALVCQTNSSCPFLDKYQSKRLICSGLGFTSLDSITWA